MQLGYQHSVSLADTVENEDKDYYFTIHDPTNGQPEKPKLGIALLTMLANVRPNCIKADVMPNPNNLVLDKKNAQLELGFATAKEVVFGVEFTNCELQPVLETQT